MSSPAPFVPIADLLERSLSIRHVYGEPIRDGDTTVVPVARLSVGFGAGGGRSPASLEDADGPQRSEGAGGGGGASMRPVGVLEIGPGGTRFIRFDPWRPWLAAGALAIFGAWLLARR